MLSVVKAKMILVCSKTIFCLRCHNITELFKNCVRKKVRQKFSTFLTPFQANIAKIQHPLTESRLNIKMHQTLFIKIIKISTTPKCHEKCLVLNFPRKKGWLFHLDRSGNFGMSLRVSTWYAVVLFLPQAQRRGRCY